MNDHEREAIILDSAWKMIDSMVNWALFCPVDLCKPTTLMFQNREHATIFIILLGDFLSQIRAYKNQPMPLDLRESPTNARPSDLTFLYHLKRVCEAPQLNATAVSLLGCIEKFSKWLEGEFMVPKVYFYDIDIEADIRIERYRYLKMCADIAKHHLGRLSYNVRHIRNLLNSAGCSVTEYEAYMAVDNFYDRFFEDVFLYHSGVIAEFLNNIRWSIFSYLQPEFHRSYHITGEFSPGLPAYRYHIPVQIQEPIAQAMYWNIMNRVRTKPLFPKFVIDDIFNQRY